MALEYSLVYAYLDCRDAHEWIELGRRCRDAQNTKQEMACYDKGQYILLFEVDLYPNTLGRVLRKSKQIWDKLLCSGHHRDL